jgi:hypothetical protein
MFAAATILTLMLTTAKRVVSRKAARAFDPNASRGSLLPLPDTCPLETHVVYSCAQEMIARAVLDLATAQGLLVQLHGWAAATALGEQSATQSGGRSKYLWVAQIAGRDRYALERLGPKFMVFESSMIAR